MKYLVTGALGAIGAWTVKSLLDRGHEVVTYDLGGSDHRLRLALTDDELASLTRIQGDVTDLAQMESAIEEHSVEALIHLAALQVPFVRDNPMAGAQVDVLGTVHALEAARRYLGSGRPVVYASSIAALALGPGVHPSTLYGVFKFANEGTAELYFSDYGVSSIGLRPHTVYGPGRDQGITSAPTAAMAAAVAGDKFRIPFGGAHRFQYVADVGEAFVRASELAYEGASVHNLDGPVATMQEVIEAIELAAPETAGLVTAAEDPLPFPVSLDASSFVELIGDPISRPLADGVAETIAAFRG